MGRQRVAVATLLVAAVVTTALLVAFASRACPGPSGDDVCASAAVNRAVVVGLASASVALLVAPFAFLGEYAARRRIVYRGAWGRAGRRAALAAGIVAVLGGLQLARALSPALVLAILVIPLLGEAYVTRLDLRRGRIS
ncbi:MAG: hypothetical protein M3295_02155 [Chloroflexota bacterium]|nr:hypothetical protein [Chloroflexota bacterium]